jgi:hypothetical protein
MTARIRAELGDGGGVKMGLAQLCIPANLQGIQQRL